MSTKSIYFSGGNDHVNIGDVPELSPERTDSFSVSAWIKQNPSDPWLANHAVVSKQLSSGNLTGWLLNIGNAGFIFKLVADSSNYIDVTAGGGINSGGWTHIAATYDGSSLASGVSMYINNVLQLNIVVSDTLASGSTITTTPAQIGIRDSIASDYVGWIDDVSFYNEELSGLDVDIIFNNGAPGDLNTDLDDGYLAGYWKMGDGDTFPIITDHSVSGNDGTMTNMVAEDIVDVFNDGYINVREDGYAPPQYITQNDASTLNIRELSGGGGGPVVVINYSMRALADPGPGYVYWTVQGDPDFSGTFAPSAIQGGSAVIITQWVD